MLKTNKEVGVQMFLSWGGHVFTPTIQTEFCNFVELQYIVVQQSSKHKNQNLERNLLRHKT